MLDRWHVFTLTRSHVGVATSGRPRSGCALNDAAPVQRTESEMPKATAARLRQMVPVLLVVAVFHASKRQLNITHFLFFFFILLGNSRALPAGGGFIGILATLVPNPGIIIILFLFFAKQPIELATPPLLSSVAGRRFFFIQPAQVSSEPGLTFYLFFFRMFIVRVPLRSVPVEHLRK